MVLRTFKMSATSGFLATSECAKFVFGRGGDGEGTGPPLRKFLDPPLLYTHSIRKTHTWRARWNNAWRKM